MFSKMFKRLSRKDENDTADEKNKMLSAIPSCQSCTYTCCYCEENIWHLCKHILKNKLPENECYCIFISNNLRAIRLWKQKLCPGTECVVWDYHVIAVYGNRNHGYYVLDLDTVLPFPVSFKEYAAEALKSEDAIMPTYRRFFRVIPAEEYVKYFSSDRRHMKMGETWQKPPPKYPPIITDPKNPHKLDEFIDMTRNKGYGEVLNCVEFIAKFS